MKSTFFLFLSLIAFSCSKHQQSEADGAPVPQAVSFSGKSLYSKVPPAALLRKSDSIIGIINKKAELSENDFIDIGRQLVATARYKEAVANYSKGLSKYHDSYKILRHRGHRYLTLRKLDSAVADLKKAETLIRSQGDVWDYDADGKQTDTYQHQIWYHLGVYYFLVRSYPEAVQAFEKSLATGHDSKEIVGTTDWLYNSYQRAGLKEKAEKLLETIAPDYNTDREQAYFRRIMLYKGVITPEELIDINLAPEKLSVQDITKLYGLANWYAFHGDKEKARGLYQKIVQSDSWPGFAYMAAEKDLMDK
jgi:tetratricopeptide (TPR) repeat protein